MTGQKLPEHLRNHYKKWLGKRNETNSISDISEDFQRIRPLLRSERPAVMQVPAAVPESLPTALACVERVTQLADEPTAWETEQVLTQHAAQ